MTSPVSPSVGLGVLHLFCKPGENYDRKAVLSAIDSASAEDVQLVTVSILGHKADIAIMALHADWWALRRLQTGLQTAGLDVVDSFLSLTEISEYADGLPEEMRNMRLYPELPPEGKPAWCFYPMSKKREVDANWFRLDFEKRLELMLEHGTSGRKFRGRILQLITGATGVDDWEWGVTLFGEYPDDLKEVVYKLRFDEASALYGEFGIFYAGIVAEPETVLDSVI